MIVLITNKTRNRRPFIEIPYTTRNPSLPAAERHPRTPSAVPQFSHHRGFSLDGCGVPQSRTSGRLMPTPAVVEGHCSLADECGNCACMSCRRFLILLVVGLAAAL